MQNAHRSHFGSRYRTGRCDPAGLFAVGSNPPKRTFGCALARHLGAVADAQYFIEIGTLTDFLRNEYLEEGKEAAKQPASKAAKGVREEGGKAREGGKE